MPPMPTQAIYQPGRPSIWPIFPQTGIPAVIQDPRTGAVYQNPKKSTQKWYWLFTSPDVEVTLGVGDVQQLGATAQLEEGSLGDFECVKLNALTDPEAGRFACRIFDTFLDRWLSNGPVASDLMFGVPEYPGTLYETIFVPASTALVFQVQNLEAVDLDVSIGLQGRRFMGCGPREAIWRAFKDRKTHPYWLTFDEGPELTVAANSTANATMTVPAGCDFDAWILMDDTEAPGTGNPAEYNLRLFEGQSGRSLFGTATPVTVPISLVAAKTRNVTGVNGGRLRAVGNPNALTFTHLFQRKTQVQVEIDNPNAFEIRVRLAFHGQAIYADDCGLGNPERLLEETVGYMPVPQPCGPSGACQPSFTAYLPGGQGQAMVPSGGVMSVPPNGVMNVRPVLGPGYGAVAPGPIMQPPQPGMQGWRRY